jgi:hypothetical protein
LQLSSVSSECTSLINVDRFLIVFSLCLSGSMAKTGDNFWANLKSLKKLFSFYATFSNLGFGSLQLFFVVKNS